VLALIIIVVPLVRAQTTVQYKPPPKAYANDDGSDYFLRLNYGLVARRLKQVCPFVGYWHQILHVELPSKQPEIPISPVCQKRDANTTICSPECNDECKRIHDLYEEVCFVISQNPPINSHLDNLSMDTRHKRSTIGRPTTHGTQKQSSFRSYQIGCVLGMTLNCIHTECWP
jgi:hypothetical protein